jgi:hypothetical protein
MGHVRKSACRREHRGALSLCIGLLAASLPCAGRAQPAHAGHAPPAARVPTATLTSELVTDGGAFALELTTSPQPIKLNELFELTVVVRPVASDSRGSLSVTADARMPAHSHGMNTRLDREDLGDGRFLFRGLLFHMAGEWEVVLEVAQGRVRDRATARLVIE